MKRQIDCSLDSNSSVRSRTYSNSEQAEADSSRVQSEPSVHARNALPIHLPAPPSNVLTAHIQVAVPPTVGPINLHYGLTPETWQLVLSKLSVFDLIRAMQCCRSFFEWSRVVPPPLSDVNSKDAERLKTLSFAHLMASFNSCAISLSDSEIREYYEVVRQMGSLSTSVAVIVLEGVETAVIAALCDAPRWQHLALTLELGADSDILGDLQEALARTTSPDQLPRTLDLILLSNVDADRILASYTKPDPQTLGKPGLRLRMLHVEALDCSEEYLSGFLRSDNQLEDLNLQFKSPTDPLLPALKWGSSALRSLNLAELPDSHEDLIEVLECKSDLTALALANGEFTASGTTVAKLLQARAKLERLTLTGINMQLGSTEACTEAFRRSKLREFGFIECSFEWMPAGMPTGMPTAGVESKASKLKALLAPYFELFAGLAAAPHLQTLELGGRDAAPVELSALAAFALNPSATCVRCCKEQGVIVSKFVEMLNRKRQGNALPPIALELAVKPDLVLSLYPIERMGQLPELSEEDSLEDDPLEDGLRQDELPDSDQSGDTPPAEDPTDTQAPLQAGEKPDL